MNKPSFHLKSYPWYVADWRMSETRLRLSPVGRYIYRELIDHCYNEGSLPHDEAVLARIVDVPLKDFRREWPSVKRSFHEGNDGRLHNQKVDEVLPSLEKWHEQKRVAGQAGGKARAQANAKRPLSGRQADDEALLKPSTSTSTTTSASPEENPLPPADSDFAETLPVQSPIIPILDECEQLYAMAGKPLPEKHRNLAVQLLLGINPDKLPRLPNYIKWALSSGTWSDPAHTKSLLNLIRDGDWDVELTHRTLPTVVRDKSRGQVAQDEATRSFLAKRGAL